MIIWLASYPKSGNTLLRSIIGTYFFSKDGEFKFDYVYQIGQFPQLNYFDRIGINTSNDKEIFKNYVNAQNLINENNKKIKFFKTHSAFFEHKEKNSNFTNEANSLGAIYVVRDPRNVATSYAHHYSVDIDEATKRICNKGLFNVKTDLLPETYLSSWGNHYLSWKRKDLKVLLVKYEDLIKDKKKSLINIFKFFETLGMNKSVFNIAKLNKVIKSTDFQKMKELEKKKGFHESALDPKTGKKKDFFNKGPNNNWENNLTDKNRKYIEENFKKEMQELGYL